MLTEFLQLVQVKGDKNTLFSDFENYYTNYFNFITCANKKQIDNYK